MAAPPNVEQEQARRLRTNQVTAARANARRYSCQLFRKVGNCAAAATASLDNILCNRPLIGIRLVQGDEGGAAAKPGQDIIAQDARRLFGQDRAVG